MAVACSVCKEPAKMKCPTCLKLSLQPTYFCGQDCFKKSWSSHKLLHVPTLAPYNPFPTYKFTGTLKPLYPISLRRSVPPHIPLPDYHETSLPLSEQKLRGSTTIAALTKEEEASLRDVCAKSREVLEAGKKCVAVGVTTDEIDRVVHEICCELGVYPSPLNYFKFPKSCCTSVNEVICHGIPDRYELRDGDIVNIDVSCFNGMMHGDLNDTVLVGNVDQAGIALTETAKQCMDLAIAQVKPGYLYRDLGAIIEQHAAKQGFSVVRSYCGHGIGRNFHSAPSVPHYGGNKAVGVMRVGHAFTIEPMISEGTWKDQTWPDNWTAVTRDGKRSAQFEQTMIVTEQGCDVLTK